MTAPADAALTRYLARNPGSTAGDALTPVDRETPAALASDPSATLFDNTFTGRPLTRENLEAAQRFMLGLPPAAPLPRWEPLKPPEPEPAGTCPNCSAATGGETGVHRWSTGCSSCGRTCLNPTGKPDSDLCSKWCTDHPWLAPCTRCGTTITLTFAYLEGMGPECSGCSGYPYCGCRASHRGECTDATRAGDATGCEPVPAISREEWERRAALLAEEPQ